MRHKMYTNDTGHNVNIRLGVLLGLHRLEEATWLTSLFVGGIFWQCISALHSVIHDLSAQKRSLLLQRLNQGCGPAISAQILAFPSIHLCRDFSVSVSVSLSRFLSVSHVANWELSLIDLIINSHWYIQLYWMIYGKPSDSLQFIILSHHGTHGQFSWQFMPPKKKKNL